MDIEKRNLVMLKYQPLVAMRARKFFAKISTKADLTVEDLISHGQIGLMRGIESFDETKGAKLVSWLYINIDGEIREEIRRECARTGYSRHIYDSATTENIVKKIPFDEFLHSESAFSDTADALGTASERLWVLDQMWRLESCDRIIALMFFYGFFNGKQIGIVVGKKEQAIRYRLASIRSQLTKWRRKNFADNI